MRDRGAAHLPRRCAHARRASGGIRAVQPRRGRAAPVRAAGRSAGGGHGARAHRPRHPARGAHGDRSAQRALWRAVLPLHARAGADARREMERVGAQARRAAPARAASVRGGGRDALCRRRCGGAARHGVSAHARCRHAPDAGRCTRARGRDAPPAQPPGRGRAARRGHARLRSAAPAHGDGAAERTRERLGARIRRSRRQRPLRRRMRGAVYGLLRPRRLFGQGHPRRARAARLLRRRCPARAAHPQPRRARGRLPARRLSRRRGAHGYLPRSAACLGRAGAPVDPRRLAERAVDLLPARTGAAPDRPLPAGGQPAALARRPGDVGSHLPRLRTALAGAAAGGICRAAGAGAGAHLCARSSDRAPGGRARALSQQRSAGARRRRGADGAAADPAAVGGGPERLRHRDGAVAHAGVAQKPSAMADGGAAGGKARRAGRVSARALAGECARAAHGRAHAEPDGAGRRHRVDALPVRAGSARRAEYGRGCAAAARGAAGTAGLGKGDVAVF